MEVNGAQWSPFESKRSPVGPMGTLWSHGSLLESNGAHWVPLGPSEFSGAHWGLLVPIGARWSP
eukprot:4206657-Lingulodinium_polyedra.AAC.1